MEKISQKPEEIQKEIEDAREEADSVREELLRHYLVNLILYINLEKDAKETSAVGEALQRLTFLLEKIMVMKKKLENSDTRRIASRQMMKNKDSYSSAPPKANPKQKNKKKEDIREKRAKKNPDYNIRTERNFRK